MRNPCLECDFRDEDKNNRRCQECDERIAYIENIDYRFDGPKERVAYTDILVGEEEAKRKIETISDDLQGILGITNHPEPHKWDDSQNAIQDIEFRANVAKQFLFVKNGFFKVFEIQQIFIDIKILETKVNMALSNLCKGKIDLKTFKSNFIKSS